MCLGALCVRPKIQMCGQNKVWVRQNIDTLQDFIFIVLCIIVVSVSLYSSQKDDGRDAEKDRETPNNTAPNVVKQVTTINPFTGQ